MLVKFFSDIIMLQRCLNDIIMLLNSIYMLAKVFNDIIMLQRCLNDMIMSFNSIYMLAKVFNDITILQRCLNDIIIFLEQKDARLRGMPHTHDIVTVRNVEMISLTNMTCAA